MSRELDMPTFFTVQETADILRVTERTIYNYIKSEKLKAKKIGHDWKIKKEDLQSFIDSM